MGVVAAPVAHATIFVVDDTGDTGDAAPGNGACADANGKCTLRAAVQEANAMSDADVIELPPGTYSLTLEGTGDDDAAVTGDLDIVNDVSIGRSGNGAAVISGNNVVRVFDVMAPAHVILEGLTIQDGNGLTAAGGGIRNTGTLVLADVAVVHNSAARGGGIANLVAGAVSLVNVTVSSNNATTAGGGLSNDQHTGTLDLKAVTVTANTAPIGAGIDSLGIARLRSVIVAKNLIGANCHGEIVSLGHNLENGISCLFDADGDLNTPDPGLGTLGDNGSFTLTHALLPGSPAIDAGDNTGCPVIDQRDQPRPTDGNGDGIAVCDIGAYEAPGPLAPTLTPTPPESDTPTLSPIPAETPTVTPRRAGIDLGTATGAPGGMASFSAVLRTAGFMVASSNNDIGFDNLNAPIAALPNGRPDCTVNPSINKQQSFNFRPPTPTDTRTPAPSQCTGTGCTAVRAAVFDLSEPILPIADGATLYTCNVAISADTPLGEYPLRISRLVLGDPDGTAIPDVTGTDGKVLVVAPATTTPTETATATPTTTATPTVSPTTTPTPSCVGDCNRDTQVTVDEILTMLLIGLGNADLDLCLAADANHDGIVTVDEILTAVNNDLNGCPLAG